MTDYRKLIDELLKRAPAPGRVIYVQQVREFKRVAEDARKAKSQAAMESAYNTLKGYYE